MSKKQSKNLLRIGELAKVSGTRISTLKYYSEIGILYFKQEDAGLTRRYDEEKAVKRLKEIKRLQDRGLSIEEIIGKLGDSKNR